jgi:hypothetical protein
MGTALLGLVWETRGNAMWDAMKWSYGKATGPDDAPPVAEVRITVRGTIGIVAPAGTVSIIGRVG